MRRLLAYMTLVVAALFSVGASTTARLLDVENAPSVTITAGVWEDDEPDSLVPPECADMVFSGDPIVGTDGNDRLQGTDGNDLIIGMGGDDILFGGKGNDCLVGGAGNDFLGGNGLDDLHSRAAGEGLAVLFGIVDEFLERGEDVLVGGDGSDALYGGPGVDELHGGSGSDLLLGGLDPDLLFGGSGEDLLKGVFAGLVHGGSSDDLPDVEQDTCLFLLVHPSTFLSCESPASAPPARRGAAPPEGEGEGESLIAPFDDASSEDLAEDSDALPDGEDDASDGTDESPDSESDGLKEPHAPDSALAGPPGPVSSDEGEPGSESSTSAEESPASDAVSADISGVPGDESSTFELDSPEGDQ